MLRTSLIFVCVAACAQVPETTVMSGRATLDSGAVFAFRSVLRPPGTSMAGLGVGGIFSDPDGNTVHRYMIDRSTGSCFGYDVVIGAADPTGAYLVTFQPLSQIDRIEDARGLKPIVLPAYPAPQMMHDGEQIELDLMVSPDGKRKLTDYIAIQRHEPPLSAARTNIEPKDFTPDDGAISFDATRYVFLRGGQKYQGSTGFTGKPGATLWIAYPGEGRYVLSLIPHDGFVKSGTVRDNVVAFEDSGQKFEIRFQSPVAGAGKAWNLYVLHDAGYPAGQIVQMGTDRLENLIAKH